MEKKRFTGFVLYESYLDALNELPAEEFKEMVNAMMTFMQEDIEPEFEKPIMRIIFKSLKPNLEANKIKYLEKRMAGLKQTEKPDIKYNKEKTWWEE